MSTELTLRTIDGNTSHAHYQLLDNKNVIKDVTDLPYLILYLDSHNSYAKLTETPLAYIGKVPNNLPESVASTMVKSQRTFYEKFFNNKYDF